MKKYIILIFTIVNTFIFAQNIKEKLIDPVKIDSSLAQENILKYFVRDDFEDILEFQDSNFAKTKIYNRYFGRKEFIKIDKDTLSLIFEIKKNENGKISSIKYTDYDDEYCFDVNFIYNTNGNLTFIKKNGFDLIDKSPTQEIKIIRYDDFGNLSNEFSYKVKNNVYQLDFYQEFKFEKVNNNLLVFTKKLEFHSRQNIVIKEILNFDKNSRLDKYQLLTNSQRNKEIYNTDNVEVINENYFYENDDFPNKITKKINKLCECEEKFSYYATGALNKYEKITKNDYQLISNQFLENQKKIIQKYRKTNNQILYDKNFIQFFDRDLNLVFEKEKSNKDEITYDKEYSYKFDSHKNWVFKKIKVTDFLLKKSNENTLPDEELVVREINYTNFDNERTDTIIDSKAEKLLNDFLKKENFAQR